MVDILFWVVISAIAYFLVLPFALGIALATVILVWLVPGWRGTRSARVAAWVTCGFAALVALIASPMLAQAFHDDVVIPIHQARLRRSSGDHSRTVAGIILPPRSYVQLDDGGNIAYGHVSSPTNVYGFPLAGDFSMEESYWSDDGHPYVGSGTLTKPFVYRGIPCAATKFDISQSQIITCTLAHDAVLFGIPLRGGTKIAASISRFGKPSLESGFLGRPCEYFGIDWPTGTKIESDSQGINADVLQGRIPGDVMFTLPSGATRNIAGRTIRAGIPVPFENGKPDLSMLDSFLKMSPSTEN